MGQAILTYQPRPGTTIQGYYQFEWEHDYFQGEGAYFNSVNFFDKGASFLTLANTGHALDGLTRTGDLTRRPRTASLASLFNSRFPPGI